MKAAHYGPKRIKGLLDNYQSLAIVAALLLISFSSFAQYDSLKVRQIQSSYGFEWKNAKINSSFIIPNDTPKLAYKDSGAVSYKGGSLWAYNGRYWTGISGSGSTPVNDIVIYKENTEWSGYTDIPGGLFNYTTSPYAGTYSTYSPAFSVGQYIEYTAPDTYTATGYDTLRVRIKNLDAFNSSTKYNFRFYNGVDIASSAVTVNTGLYGWDRTISGTYQDVKIPVNSFGFTGPFNKLFVGMSGANSTGFQLDNIILSSGGANTGYVLDSLMWQTIYKAYTDSIAFRSALTDTAAAIRGDMLTTFTFTPNYNNKLFLLYTNGVLTDSVPSGVKDVYGVNGISVIDSIGNVYISGAGISGGTLQQAFDKSVLAGDDPVINGRGNDFKVDSAGYFRIRSQQGDVTDEIYDDEQIIVIKSRNNVIGSEAQARFGASDSTNAVSDMQASGIYTGVPHQSYFGVTPKYFKFLKHIGSSGEQDNPKVIFEGIDTLSSPPSYIAAFEGDTLKKVAYPSGGGGSSKFGKPGEDVIATENRRFNVNANDFEISGVNVFSDTQYLKFDRTNGIEIGGGYSGGGTTRLLVGQSTSILSSTLGADYGEIRTNNGTVDFSSTAKDIRITVDSSNLPQNMLYVDAYNRIWKAAVPAGGGGSGITSITAGYGTTGGTITTSGTLSADTTVLETKESAVNRAALKMNIAPVIQTITSGTAATVTDSTTWFIVNPATLLSATITLTMPPNPTNGKMVEFGFGGTINAASSIIASTVTFAPNTGQGIVGATSFYSLEVEDRMRFRYNSSNSKWYQQ